MTNTTDEVHTYDFAYLVYEIECDPAKQFQRTKSHRQTGLLPDRAGMKLRALLDPGPDADGSPVTTYGIIRNGLRLPDGARALAWVDAGGVRLTEMTAPVPQAFLDLAVEILAETVEHHRKSLLREAAYVEAILARPKPVPVFNVDDWPDGTEYDPDGDTVTLPWGETVQNDQSGIIRFGDEHIVWDSDPEG